MVNTMPGLDLSSLGFAGNPAGLISSGVSAVVGEVTAVEQAVQARKQRRMAADMAKNTVRPIYSTPQEIKDNQALAESRASQGLSDAATVTYKNESDRALTSSIDAILRSGGSPNNFAEVYDSQANNFDKLALIEEEIRQKNLSNYMKQNETSADYADKEFMVNQWGPYQDRRQAIADLTKQAAANKSAAINTFGSSINNFLSGSKMNGAGSLPNTGNDNGAGGAGAGGGVNTSGYDRPTPESLMLQKLLGGGI